jgi:hypothetical protein
MLQQLEDQQLQALREEMAAKEGMIMEMTEIVEEEQH